MGQTSSLHLKFRLRMFILVMITMQTVLAVNRTVMYRITSVDVGSSSNVTRTSRVQSLLECANSARDCVSVSHDGDNCLCHDLPSERLSTYPSPGGVIFERKWRYITTIQSEYLGGNSGSPFSDADYYSVFGSITGLRLLCGNYFEGIQMKYGSVWAPQRGIQSSACAPPTNNITYSFSVGENIVSLKANYGSHIDGIVVTTNKRVLPKCGGNGGNEVDTVTGEKLLYISGQEGCYIDGILGHWGY